MVRHAFRVLSHDQIKTRLIAFSDDMDGLRKVPDNVPNPEMLRYLNRLSDLLWLLGRKHEMDRGADGALRA